MLVIYRAFGVFIFVCCYFFCLLLICKHLSKNW